MKNHEIEMLIALYQSVVREKIKDDKRYSNSEVLADCLAAVAYLFAEIENKKFSSMYEDMKKHYVKESSEINIEEELGKVIDYVEKTVKNKVKQ